MAATHDEWLELTEAERWELYQLTEAHEAELEKVLDMLPCPHHGRCLPHAKNRIEELLRIEEMAQTSEVSAIALADPAELTAILKLLESWRDRVIVGMA